MNENPTSFIDAHVHLFSISHIEQLARIVKEQEYSAINIACVPAGLTEYADVHTNYISLLYKALFPNETYVFGGLDYSVPGALDGEVDFADQAMKLLALGADGMKMLEGKPDGRAALNMPLNSPVFDNYYKWLQENRVPLLFHAADPAEFWDPLKIPHWAMENGWCYADDSYLSREELYEEIEDILYKFPNLTVIFAHFFFLSHDIEKAERILNKWPNVHFDLTPGVEMYYNFAHEQSVWREFFSRYQDRIIFGTDTAIIEETLPTKVIRYFLETEDASFGGRGLALEKPILDRIYHKNIINLVGTTPRSLHMEAIMEDCQKTIERVTGTPNREQAIQELNDVIKRLRDL